MKKISQQELEQTLDSHRRWASAGIGNRANFSNTDLRGMVLRCGPESAPGDEIPSFHQANLEGAHLGGMDLTRLDFNNADMRSAKLTNANCTNATFHGTQISGADFSETTLDNTDFNEASADDALFVGCSGKGTKFYSTSLKNADFSRANLCEASFSKVDLNNANFSFSNLRLTQFRHHSDCLGACFRHSMLKDTQLRGTSGLKVEQLGGADLANAFLPDAISGLDGLEYVSEICKAGRSVFLTLIAGCFFSWLTIGTTTDAALISNNSGKPLPIIQIELPISSFFMVAPFILLALYIYLHMYGQRLWVALGALPGRFVDGSALDERAHPWLLTSLVRLYFPVLRTDRRALWWLQVLSSYIAAWGLVPLTILWFWARYLSRRDLGGSLWLATLFALSILVLATTAVFARNALSETIRTQSLKGYVIGLIAFFTVGATTFMTSNIWWPFERFGFTNYARLDEEFVSVPPQAFRDTKDDFVLIAGAQLKNADLTHSTARSAFLDRANLTQARIDHADYSYARLSGAGLAEANLNSSLFVGARFEGADLSHARLTGSDFSRANFHGAEFQGADFESAVIFRANFSQANLEGAVNLTQPQLDEACGDVGTFLPAGLTIKDCLEVSGWGFD